MLRNRRSVWNVRAIAEARDLVRLEADDAALVEQDVAVVGLVDAGDQVEERRLAGAVRADHADDLALVDVQVELGDDLEAAERQRDAAQLEQGAVGHQMISTRRSPRRPFGRSDHEHDQHHAEDDVARRVGLREQDVLPHERAEVERRHEQRR